MLAAIRKRLLVYGVLGGIIAVVIFSIAASESFQDCEHNRKDHKAYRALHEEHSIGVKAIVRLELHASCAVEAAHENEGPLTLLATILIAGFTGTLWFETNRLWRAHEKQIGVATTAANAAVGGLALAREKFITENRAYLSASPLSIQRVANNLIVETYRFIPVWQNTGVTPAVKIRMNNSIKFLTKGESLPNDFDYPDDPRISTGYYPPVGKGVPCLGAQHTYPALELQARMNRGEKLIVYAWVEYNDIFGSKQRYRSEFCVEARLKHSWMDGNVNVNGIVDFTPMGNFNGIDDSCLQAPKTT
jgi:hypothetical protein